MTMLGKSNDETKYAIEVLCEALQMPKDVSIRTAAFHAAQAIKGFRQGDTGYIISLEGSDTPTKPAEGYNYTHEIRELKCTPFTEVGKACAEFYFEVKVEKGASLFECVNAFKKHYFTRQFSAILIEKGRDRAHEDAERYVITFDTN